MIIRWTSFILLLYLFWNHNKWSISTSEENLVSLEVIKHISTYALSYFVIIIILCLIINILYSVKRSFPIIIISYIISVIIIIIVTTLGLRILMYNESTDILICIINHPLSGEAKVYYFIKYIEEQGIAYSRTLEDINQQMYFRNTLYSYTTKIKPEDIMKMSIEQIENYSLQLIQEAAFETYWRDVLYIMLGIMIFVNIVSFFYV